MTPNDEHTPDHASDAPPAADERRIDLDTSRRQDFGSKIRRGLGRWWRGEITLRRLVNAGLCTLSLRRRHTRVLGKPYFLTIESTNACNLRCPLCPTGRGTLERPTTMLPLELFKKCIDEVGRYLLSMNVSNYGEPMLNRDVAKMIAYAKTVVPDVVMACNAHFITEESARDLVESGLDRIYISFDGTDQETYEKYRVRGDFAQVLKGTRTLLDQRAKLGRTTPFVEAQFLVMKHNEHQIETFRKLADEVGVDRRIIKPVSFNVADWDDEGTRETYARFFPDNEDYRVYRHEGDDWQWKRDGLDFCTAPWRSITVLADGAIVPCCRDPRGHYTMGNVADGVVAVWNNKKYQAFRRGLIERRDKMPICKICPGE